MSDVRRRDVDHQGHAAIELACRGVRLVIVHSIGPRIAWFGAQGGDNLLFWDDASAHRRGPWQLYGGHRLWITRPLADETEETYAPDNRACRTRPLRDGVVIVAPTDVSGIEKSLVSAPAGTAGRSNTGSATRATCCGPAARGR